MLRLEFYNGYIVTPHAFVLDGELGTWTVGVFVRSANEPVVSNKYFCNHNAIAHSENDAREQGIAYAKQIIDRHVLNAMRITDKPHVRH
jgi:hypothetical protein